jgi:uncharacterized membrane protein required for colicin V production
MINWLDIAILAALLVVIAIGFIGGFVRLVSMSIAIYLGAVIAGRWYMDLTEEAHRHISGFDIHSGQFFVFGAVMVIASTALTSLISRGIGRIRFPRRIEIADNVLGACVAVVATALSLVPMSLVLQALNQSVLSSSGGSLIGGAKDQIEGSAFIPFFLKLAPVFVHMMSPWFPSGMPPILSVVH